MASETRNRLVDAAEMLLARDGWDNVSVRAVAAHAEANLSAISYHFGSFRSLRKQVLARRLVPLNEARKQNLVELQNRTPNPPLERILHAYLDPLLKLSSSSDQGARAFLLILARNSIEPSAEYRSVIGNELSSHTAAFAEALKQVVPGVTKMEIENRFRFAIGAISRALAAPSSRRLGWEAESVQQLFTFLVAGFEAPPTPAIRKK
jgi:AcrR family transcriptional regulator